MKYVWTVAAMLLEPMTNIAFWLAAHLHQMETICLTHAGEARDE